jgi:RNA polymerase sigma-70 factor (sigma-E family)
VDIVNGERSRHSPAPPSVSCADSGSGEDGVTALYAAHAVGLARLAFIMLGDRGAAEDVVQDAFLGLYRNWGRLASPENALTYVRSAVLNNCRAALRSRARRERRDRAAATLTGWPSFDSAADAVLLSEEHRSVLAAVGRLPDRQREALTLRYYLGLSHDEAASVMKVSTGTVKSALSRAIAALGQMLKEES